jgi:hypothetical protein
MSTLNGNGLGVVTGVAIGGLKQPTAFPLASTPVAAWAVQMVGVAASAVAVGAFPVMLDGCTQFAAPLAVIPDATSGREHPDGE